MRFISYCVLLLTAACASAPAAETEAPEAQPIVIGESRHIKSVILRETRTYNVWLPPSYSEDDAAYPVLYVLDGGLHQDFHHISGLAQLSTITGMFRDIIVVGVETIDRRAELTSPSDVPRDKEDFPTHGEAAAFRAFLTDEVMPDVTAHYRISDESVLMGESLAGLFIMETLLTAPDTADGYIAISPSLWWDRGSLANNAEEILLTLPKGKRQLYLAIANEGGLMREGFDKITRIVQHKKIPGLRWRASIRADQEHSTVYHREALEALVWAFANPEKEAKH